MCDGLLAAASIDAVPRRLVSKHSPKQSRLERHRHGACRKLQQKTLKLTAGSAVCRGTVLRMQAR